MDTPASVKTSPVKQFFLGFALGVGVELAASAVGSFIFQIVTIAVFSKREPNMNIMGALSIGLPVILLITTLVVVQKTLKSKLLTLGVAAGWITVTVAAALAMFAVFKLAGLK